VTKKGVVKKASPEERTAGGMRFLSNRDFEERVGKGRGNERAVAELSVERKTNCLSGRNG
jgi:hypothetical protein